MAERSAVCLVAFLVMCCASQVRSDGSNHQYKAGDTIPLYANGAGPFDNPIETYAYNDLPYCSSEQVKQKKESIGEVLNGHCLVSTPNKLNFLVEKQFEVACKKKLTKEEVSQFAAAVGSGTQLFILSIFIIMLGYLEYFNHMRYDRGALFTALVLVYAITFVIAGYTTVSLYCQFEGTNWVRSILLSGCVFGGPLFLTFCFLNTVASTYRVNAALPLWRILLLFSIWLFGASPLLLFGGIAGRNSLSEFQAPCRTTKCPREIPTLRWYRGILPQMAVAGILPYSVMYFETPYLLESLWGHRIYAPYGIWFIFFINLVIITAFVTVALTYFQLAAEDHEWWWRSFLCGRSSGLFIYGQCLYYYSHMFHMSGFLQTSFFFGYMACICYGIFLMLGTIGFRASLLFVRHKYGSIKCE